MRLVLGRKVENFNIELKNQKQEYINSFIKNNYRTIKLRVKKDNKLIINKINNVENINKYIINLILKDIEENRIYNYVNDTIEIDFELSNTMIDLIEKAEDADLIDDYGLYMNLADVIDSRGKKEASNHIITETE